MAWFASYDYITRKQCNVIYKAFKQGKLTPPKDGRGRVKRPGFVYDYEYARFRCGFYPSDDDQIYNFQVAAIREIVGLIIKGDYAKAQDVLDVRDEDFNRGWMPSSTDKRKMWKLV